MADPQIADPFAQVNAAATQPAVVDPFAVGYEAPKGPLLRGANAALRGVTSGAAATVALAANAAGAKDLGASALAAAKSESDAGAKDTMRVEDVDSFGGGLDFLQYALGYLGTQLGGNVVAGGVGRALGGAGARAIGATAGVMAAKQAGTVAGLAGSSLMQEIGQIYPDAVDNGVADPIQRSLLGATIAAAADVLPEAYVARRAGLLGKSERGAGPLKEALKVGGAEAGTELFQTYVERASSGQPVTGDEAMSDYLNSMVLGAFGGAIAGGVAGQYNKTRSLLDNSTAPAPAAPDQAAPSLAQANVAPEPGVEPTAPAPAPAAQPAPLSLNIPADAMTAADISGPDIQDVPNRVAPDAKTSEPVATLLAPESAPTAADVIAPRVEGFQRSATDLVRDRAIAQAAQPIETPVTPASDRTTTAAERLSSPLPVAEPPAKVAPYSGPVTMIGKLGLVPDSAPNVIVPAAAAEPIPAFARSATDLVAARGQPALTVPEVRSPRESVPAFDSKAAREQAMQQVAAVTDQHMARLAAEGVVKPDVAPRIGEQIRRSAEAALANPDEGAAKQGVADGVKRALRGNVPAVDAQRIADDYSSALDEVRLNSKAATKPQLAAGDVTRFSGESPDKIANGSFDVRVVNPHSNAAQVSNVDSRGRMYEGNNAHIATATVENVRTGRQFEAYQYRLAQPAVAASSSRPAGRVAPVAAGSPVEQAAAATPSVDVSSPDLLQSRTALAPQVDAMLRAQGDAAIARVQDVVGTPPNLKIQSYLSDRGAGAIRLGTLRDVIELNLNAKDVLSVANHEAFHYLEHRVLPKEDLAAVTNAFRVDSPMFNRLIDRVRAYDAANGTTLESEVRGVPAEARAYAFEFWNRGELAAQGVVQRAFQAISRAIERIQNWVKGSGFKSYEDVFDAIDRGYYAQRYGSPFENVRLAAPNGLELASQASLNEMAQRAKLGEIPQVQINARIAELLDDADAVGDVRERYLERAADEAKGLVGNMKRFYLSKISSGENLARKSLGYKNVFNVLTTYAQRKNRLIADGVEKQLSKWVKQASAVDKTAVSAALLERTTNGYETDSAQYQTVRERLTSYQREMFDQATSMIGSRLEDEFIADQGTYGRVLGKDTQQYQDWYANRRAQVDALKKNGYFPERRYGDHVVHAYVEQEGKRLTLYYSQHEREADARVEERDLKRALATEPGVHVEYGYRYRAQYDGSVSFQQFLDMATRHGIDITQAEKERLAKALVAADSVRRNRVFRRKNIAGYSEDGMRVLAEFGVAMANKIAYHELGGAVNDAIAGRAVTAQFTRDGSVQVNTQPNTNLWDQDGAMGGYFRNLSDQTADFVLSPRSTNPVSRGLRALASVQFLGGSISAGMVQLTSMAMNTTPWLTQYTGYTDALARSFDGYKTAMSQHKLLTDLPTILNENVRIDGVDNVEGLRHALQIAAQDGTTLDTEIYQLMGLSRGQEYSLSGRAQQAVKAWMTPFRITEQWNRTGTFIAAFKLAKDQGQTNDAAYKTAQESVYATQFRYDEANRPALARSDVGALLFVFKSYPIFMLETMAHLAKVSPHSAVVMMLTLSLMSGVEGLPFAEDMEDMIDTIAQRIFGSSFNTKRALRNVLKSASEAVTGADLSSVMVHGMANELTGLSFASRVGLGNLIPGTRIGTADADYKRTMGEILGPIGTIVTGGLSGADSLSKGDFVGAAKQALPLAAQNLVKGVQDWKQGYASDLGGRKLVDVTGWEAFWQALGFSTSALNRAYEADSIDKQTSAFYKQAHDDFMKDIVKAVREGDPASIERATGAVSAWNQAHPGMPIAVSPESVRRNVQLAGLPINQRTMQTLPRTLRGSSEYVLGLQDH